jgi:hypothetical protein
VTVERTGIVSGIASVERTGVVTGVWTGIMSVGRTGVVNRETVPGTAGWECLCDSCEFSTSRRGGGDLSDWKKKEL